TILHRQSVVTGSRLYLGPGPNEGCGGDMNSTGKGRAVASAFVAAVMGLSLGSGIAMADDGPPPNTIRLPIEIPGITPFVDIPLPSQEDVDGINAALAGAGAEMDRLAREFMDALD